MDQRANAFLWYGALKGERRDALTRRPRPARKKPAPAKPAASTMSPDMQASWAALRKSVLLLFLDGGWFLGMIRQLRMKRQDWLHLCALIRHVEKLLRLVLKIWAFSCPIDFDPRKTRSRWPFDLSLHLAFRRAVATQPSPAREAGPTRPYEAREFVSIFGCAQRLQSLLHIVANPELYKRRLQRHALSPIRKTADLAAEIFRARCLLEQHKSKRAAPPPTIIAPRTFEARLTLSPEQRAARRRFFASG